MQMQREALLRCIWVMLIIILMLMLMKMIMEMHKDDADADEYDTYAADDDAKGRHSCARYKDTG